MTYAFETRSYSPDELIEIVNGALESGDKRAAQIAWQMLLDEAPAALDRIAPERASEPLRALERLIQNVCRRLPLQRNVLRDVNRPGFCRGSIL